MAFRGAIRSSDSGVMHGAHWLHGNAGASGSQPYPRRGCDRSAGMGVSCHRPLATTTSIFVSHPTPAAPTTLRSAVSTVSPTQGAAHAAHPAASLSAATRSPACLPARTHRDRAGGEQYARRFDSIDLYNPAHRFRPAHVRCCREKMALPAVGPAVQANTASYCKLGEPRCCAQPGGRSWACMYPIE